MNLIKLRLDYLIFGGSGFILMLSILTADFQDPTVFNQLYPSAGIQNWTGLIGALIGGFLLEIFGPSILLLPWLIVRTVLHQPRCITILAGTYYSFVLVFLLSIFHEIVLQTGLLKSVNIGFLWQNGYAGRMAVNWLEQSYNLALSLAALTVMFIFSLVRMSQLLSPLPFFSGFLTGIQNFLIIFVRKISPPPISEYPSTTQLPIFKGHSHLVEKNSVY